MIFSFSLKLLFLYPSFPLCVPVSDKKNKTFLDYYTLKRAKAKIEMGTLNLHHFTEAAVLGRSTWSWHLLRQANSHLLKNVLRIFRLELCRNTELFPYLTYIFFLIEIINDFFFLIFFTYVRTKTNISFFLGLGSWNIRKDKNSKKKKLAVMYVRHYKCM